MANSNRRNNSIEALSANGSISSGQSAIREHIVHYYDDLFSEQFNWQPKLDGLDFDSIDAEEAFGLESLFEVLEVLKGMHNVCLPWQIHDLLRRCI